MLLIKRDTQKYSKFIFLNSILFVAPLTRQTLQTSWANKKFRKNGSKTYKKKEYSNYRCPLKAFREFKQGTLRQKTYTGANIYGKASTFYVHC